jgi:GT2 family glycosyltransferase
LPQKDRPVCLSGPIEQQGTEWVHVGFAPRVPSGRWIRLTYLTPLYDDPARPVVRISTADGEREHSMPAGLFGRGEWIGYLPSNTVGVSLRGAALHDVRWAPLSFAAAAWHACLKDPLAVLRAAGLSLTGRVGDAREELRAAANSTHLRGYHRWRTRHSRPIDRAGLDAAASVAGGPRFLVLIECNGAADRPDLERTLESLRRQSHDRWSAREVSGTSASVPLRPLAGPLGDRDLLLCVRAGDTLPPYALAALARHALAHSENDILYGDEDQVDPRGRYVRPSFKPDWSPIYQSSVPYLGAAICLTARALSRAPSLTLTDVARGPFPADLAGRLAFGHVRRVLLTRPAPRRPLPPTVPATRATVTEEDADATIIIPTKDRPDLLGPCLASLRLTRQVRYDVVIVDNGSSRPETRALYDAAVDGRDVRMIERPGAFNFSALCNAGADAARARLLVFLNNDTLAVQADWLARLRHWALRPDCGAVGPKLLYPSGRVQHAGLVLGVGGYAAHIESGARADEPGYLGRLSATREVAAVTGACLVVEQRKFAAIGGFDTERFPVELGDVDLCLRLAERNWLSVLVAEAQLIHAESGSRGRHRDRAIRYAAEHRHFKARWGHRLLDDRFFHPALSLDSLNVRLDG